jgi:hypothetical protein
MKRVLTIWLVAVVTVSAGSFADTYTVNPGESIQAAIDGASYGDTVEVAAGVYTERITLKHGVALLGAGESITTIDGGYLGTVVSSDSCDPNTVLSGFTITRGKSSNGGGMYNLNSRPSIMNCTFSENKTNSGSEGQDEYCAIGIGGQGCGPYEEATDGGNGSNGAGIYNDNSSPMLINCTLKGNSTGSGGRGGHVYYGENSANGGYGGNGGGMYNYYSWPILINCVFINNTTGRGGSGGDGVYEGGTGGNGGNGAGIHNNYSSSTMVNCTFNSNATGFGGSGGFCYYGYGCSPFSNHGSSGSGGGMYNSNSSPTVTNCIFWDDWSGEISGSSATVTYSDIQGGYSGTGNIDSIPFSVCSTVYLSSDSACIDAGDNTAIPENIEIDLDGNPRFIDDPDTADTGNGTPPIVDMGAYEYNPLLEPIPYAGSGTVENPYQIWSGAEFVAIRCHSEDWDKHFRLMADIDIRNYHGHPIYNIIGYTVPGDDRPFTGVFDGDGHTISGFEYYDSGGPIGLFGVVEGGEIRNLGLIDPNMVSPTQDKAGLLVGYIEDANVIGCYVLGGMLQCDDKVGGLVGESVSSVITDCHVQGGTIKGDYHVGGLVGKHWGNMISNCYSKADITGNIYVGGLVGDLKGGLLSNCYAEEGSVYGQSGYVGGLVGVSGSGVVGQSADILLLDCYATCVVEGSGHNVGGLVGHLGFGETIKRCYATGTVSGTGNQVGGLIGTSWDGIIEDCFATGTVSGTEKVGGLVGHNARYDNLALIKNSYATGIVYGEEEYGGLVGRNINWDGSLEGSVVNSYWDTETSGQTTSPAGTGLPTDQMQTLSTFTDAGWDFVGEEVNGTNDIWRMCEDGVHYPHLFSQHSVHGDYACPDWVGLEDLEALALNWLTDDNDPDFNYACDGNGDGRIGLIDFSLLSRHWLKPYLNVSENLLFIHAIEGGPNPNPAELTIKNTGSGVLNWAIKLFGVLPDWLEMSSYTGSLGRAESESVTLSVDVNDLIAGDYIYDFFVVDPNAMNSPQLVTVQLHVMMAPVAHWTLDETEGQAAADSSGYGHDGMLVNFSNPDYNWVTGHLGNGLSFDGTDDYVEITGYKGITGTQARTCTAWIKTPQTTVGEIVAWGSLDTSARWSVGIKNSVLSVRVQGGSIFGSTAINDVSWHHVAVTWEPGADGLLSNAKLYVDGVLETIGSLSDIEIDTANSDNVHIGNTKDINYFWGIIDDVRIYDAALAAEDVAQLAGK